MLRWRQRVSRRLSTTPPWQPQWRERLLQHRWRHEQNHWTAVFSRSWTSSCRSKLAGTTGRQCCRAASRTRTLPCAQRCYMMRDDLSGFISLSILVTTPHNHTNMLCTQTVTHLLPRHRLSTLKGQNSQVAHVSSVLKHFIPSDTCSSAPVATNDCRFQSLFLQTAQCLKPEESLRSSGQKGRHANLQAFPDIVRKHGADGKPSFFPLPRSHSDHLVYLEKSHLPDCQCLRSTRAFIPQALSGTLQFLIRSQPRSNTQVPRDFSDPLVKYRHTYHQAFPDIV